MTSEKEIKVQIIVYPVLEDDDTKDYSLSYCITESNESKYILPSYQLNAKSFGTTKPYDFTLKPQVIYHIIPMVKDEEFKGNYGVVVYFNGKPKAGPLLSVAKNYEYMTEVESEWDSDTAGGCQVGSDSFEKNPSFLLSFEDEEEEISCTIVLSQGPGPMAKMEVIKAPFHIGFIIFDERGKERVYHTSFIDSTDVFSQYVFNTTTRKNYKIVPGTGNPEEESKFILRVFSDHKHTLESMK